MRFYFAFIGISSLIFCPDQRYLALSIELSRGEVEMREYPTIFQ